MSNDQDRIAQLEAECAALRESFSQAMETVHAYCGMSKQEGSNLDKWEKLLASTSAGKDLLNRLQAVEKERDRAIELLRSSDDDAVSVFLETIQKS